MHHALNLSTFLALTTHSSSLMSSATPISKMQHSVPDRITVLGFGSLLSPTSARLTFPSLSNFRLGRVPNHRRVFSHPASIFFQRKIARTETLEMSSLSVEQCEGKGFVCSVFEVPNDGLSDADNTGGDGWIPSRAFLEREEEFDIVMVPYDELGTIDEDNQQFSSSSFRYNAGNPPMGVICRRSTDEAYLSRWGEHHFQKQYKQYGINTIWGWERDSHLKPCPVYLRHCVLASQNCGEECHNSFLDETFLIDRKTTIREYLNLNPDLMNLDPPKELNHRYGG